MIKEYRKKRGLTQEQLAEILYMSTRQIQRIEKNETATTIETLKKLKEALDIPDFEMVKIFHEKREKKPV